MDVICQSMEVRPSTDESQQRQSQLSSRSLEKEPTRCSSVFDVSTECRPGDGVGVAEVTHCIFIAMSPGTLSVN